MKSEYKSVPPACQVHGPGSPCSPEGQLGRKHASWGPLLPLGAACNRVVLALSQATQGWFSVCSHPRSQPLPHLILSSDRDSHELGVEVAPGRNIALYCDIVDTGRSVC